jgi:hypothetical protein
MNRRPAGAGAWDWGGQPSGSVFVLRSFFSCVSCVPRFTQHGLASCHARCREPAAGPRPQTAGCFRWQVGAGFRNCDLELPLSFALWALNLELRVIPGPGLVLPAALARKAAKLASQAGGRSVNDSWISAMTESEWQTRKQRLDTRPNSRAPGGAAHQSFHAH